LYTTRAPRCSRLKEELGLDFGSDGAFGALLKECFEVIDAEYKYRLCMFDKVPPNPNPRIIQIQALG